MEVFRQTVASNVLVGSYCALTNQVSLVLGEWTYCDGDPKRGEKGRIEGGRGTRALGKEEAGVVSGI